jgi:tRNA pseudouridine55 synthase
VSGWLALDKPEGVTSTRILSEVKRLFDASKAGHAGTLDPLASGMLPIAFGEATKTVSYVMDGRKVYRFAVRWGIQTDTDDTEGRAIATSDARPTAEEILAALPEFTGTIVQVPPAYSALKIEGERAYDLARDGEEVVLEPREVEIHRLALVDVPDADHAVFEAECGKGTYVRAVARDLGRRLGTLGHVTALRRLLVGPFGEADMVTIDQLRAAANAGATGGPSTGGPSTGGPATGGPATGGPASLDAFLKPTATALFALPSLTFGGNDVARLRRGQSVILRGRDAPLFTGEAYATAAGQLIALGEVAEGAFSPRRVFEAA